MSSPDKPVLKVAPCDHAAAKYAVENWHYSRSLPAGKLFKVGAWEGDKFVGAVIFAYGANGNIGKPYGLVQTQVCELVRVALRDHSWPVSRIMRFAMKMLRDNNPGMRLAVSYADTGQDHHGGIYQATGWTYEGYFGGESSVVVNGRKMHRRQAYSLYGTTRPKGSVNVPASGKHKYLMPLDEAMKSKIEPLRKPYPKRAGSSSVEHSDSIGEVGGSTPTPALKNPEPTP
jgi:hypothetical protein